MCTTAADLSRSCNLGISAPIGNDIYSVQTFDSKGNKLGSAAVAIKVLLNVANSASISLGGTIAGVSISVLSSSPGSFTTFLDATNGPLAARLLVIGFDNAGNVILTPDTFSQPINLIFDRNLFDDSAARHALGVAPAALPFIQVAVAYANPGTGPATGTTTDQGGAISVTSPGDIVTITALLPGPTFTSFTGLLATVGPPPATLPFTLANPGTNGVPTQSGVAFEVASAPTPPPAPPTPIIAFSADQPGMTGPLGSQGFQFASAIASASNITVTDPFPLATTVTISSSDCTAAHFDSPVFPSTVTLTSGTAVFKLETTAHDGVTPAPIGSPPPTPFPTNAVLCTITATDSLGHANSLSVSVNNFTGTVQ